MSPRLCTLCLFIISRQFDLFRLLDCNPTLLSQSNVSRTCEKSDRYTITTSIRLSSVLHQLSENMSSSTSGFPPVAKLCSNCRKAQFRDDIPQLLQHGSELEFDERYLPPDKSGKFGFRNFGTIPTEFEFVDWFPELPNLIKSGRDGCDFCWFLHRAITFASSKSQDTNRARIMFVTISYAWGPYRAKGVFGEDFYGIPPGLSTMRITIHLSGDKMDSESAFTLDCGVQCLNGEYFFCSPHYTV